MLILLAVLLVITFALSLKTSASVAFAASFENESNNSRDTANTISTNSSISGNISSKNDVDWYKFTISQKGYFYVTFDHTLLSSSSNYWRIYLYNSSGNSIDGVSDSYFGVDGNANCTTNTFGVSPGTYYIKISPYSSSYWSSKNYTLRVNYVADSGWETEDNSSKDNADIIYANQTVNGSLALKDDIDWFRLKISQRGYFNISFEHDLLTSSSTYWRIYIYDQSGNTNIDGSDSYYGVSGDSNCTTYTFGVTKGTYYIKIKQYSSSYYSGRNYSLKVNFTATDDWETENNSSKNSANNISLNQTINGALSMKGDEDWYCVYVPSSREIAVTFSHELLSSSSSYWTFTIYDSSNSKIYSMSRRGDTESVTSDYISVSSGTYYVKVKQYSSSYYSGVNYSLCVLEKHEHTGDWLYSTAPTCTTSGVERRVCNICGYVETRDVAALGHQYDEGTVLKEPSLLNSGEIEYTCVVCGDSYIDKPFPGWWMLIVIGIYAIIGIIGLAFLIRAMVKGK